MLGSLNEISSTVVKQDAKLSDLEKQNHGLRAELAIVHELLRRKTNESDNQIKSLNKEVKELTSSLRNRNRTVAELLQENTRLRAKGLKSVQPSVTGSSSNSGQYEDKVSKKAAPGSSIGDITIGGRFSWPLSPTVGCPEIVNNETMPSCSTQRAKTEQTTGDKQTGNGSSNGTTCNLDNRKSIKDPSAIRPTVRRFAKIDQDTARECPLCKRTESPRWRWIGIDIVCNACYLKDFKRQKKNATQFNSITDSQS
ncbi:hypothetical protein HDE_11272 [Halotydeus destructor]|nr:hypothetical protein HDE_11272 [Halotydeus destructor]